MVVCDVSGVRATGILAEYKQDFALYLLDRGYAPLSALNQVRLMAHLSRWLAVHGLAVEHVDEYWVERFLAVRRQRGYSAWVSPGSLRVVLEFLRSVGLVPAAMRPQPVTLAEALITDYAAYLTTERGLVHATIEQRCRVALLFCGAAGLGSDTSLAQLDAGQVLEFVQGLVAGYPTGTINLMVSDMRCFLRFLYVTGKTPHVLADSVPRVADSRRRQLPKHVDPEVVEQLIASCSAITGIARRDRAILLLMARLGLRRGEVAGLQLDDLDWRAGKIGIHNTKAGRQDMLPLPGDVGEAIAGYLQHGRPVTKARQVFIRSIAPHTGMVSSAINVIVHRACQRAGVEFVAPHQLRHTLATQLLNTGVPMAELAQVLRHAHVTTTAIYAKVDYDRLALVTAPWPGSER